MSEKVLLVDDEPEFLEVMAERLRARDIEVTTTTSTWEACMKAEIEPYDAIVLDLLMPEMEGMEALKVLKHKKPDLHIILLTGYATHEKTMEAMELGAIALIEKPADIEILTEKIKGANRTIMRKPGKDIKPTSTKNSRRK